MAPSADTNPLQSLFGSLHSLLPIAVALAAWAAATWSKLKKKQQSAATPATDESERTRRVQEEVRRKIAARRGRPAEDEAMAGAPPPTRPAAWRELLERRGAVRPLDSFGGPRRRPPEPAPVPVAVPAEEEPDDTAILERQRRLAAQMRDLASGPQFAPGPGPAAPATPAPVMSSWLTELREPASVRRAIVLREILGAPVGLR